MYLIYIDDSGDPGLRKAHGSKTKAFVLSALAIRDSDWLKVLDDVIRFRRFLRKEFGISVYDELKAGHLIRGTGPASGISNAARMRIFRMVMRLQRKSGKLKVWAVVFNKDEWEERGNKADAEQVRKEAWERMIERIERFTYYEKETAAIFPDEGHPEFVRKLFRQKRRCSSVPSHFQAGTFLSRPAERILEDPNFRTSGDSYLIQLSDYNAYAAHRAKFPEGFFDGSYWEELGDARNEAVNMNAQGPKITGIVEWPPLKTRVTVS